AKSSSHHFSRRQKISKSSFRLFDRPLRNCKKASSKISLRASPARIKSAVSLEGSRYFSSTLLSIKPCSAKRCGEMNNVFPARLEFELYGENPFSLSVGFNGSNCQYFWPERCKASANRYASGPRSPVPKFPGREETCSNTPAALSFESSDFPFLAFINQLYGIAIRSICRQPRFPPVPGT